MGMLCQLRFYWQFCENGASPAVGCRITGFPNHLEYLSMHGAIARAATYQYVLHIA